MKRRYLWLLPVLGAAAWLVAQNATPPASPLPHFPPGAMLALDARDLGQLMKRADASRARDLVCERRLPPVRRIPSRPAFAGSAAGVCRSNLGKAPIDMSLVEQLAGDCLLCSIQPRRSGVSARHPHAGGSLRRVALRPATLHALPASCRRHSLLCRHERRLPPRRRLRDSRRMGRRRYHRIARCPMPATHGRQYQQRPDAARN